MNALPGGRAAPRASCPGTCGPRSRRQASGSRFLGIVNTRVVSSRTALGQLCPSSFVPKFVTTNTRASSPTAFPNRSAPREPSTSSASRSTAVDCGTVEQQDARDAMRVGRERRLLEVVGRAGAWIEVRQQRRRPERLLRPRTNSPYQASPRRGSSSFSARPGPCPVPSRPLPRTACDRWSPATGSAAPRPPSGNSRANPTSSMNRAARSIRAIGAAGLPPSLRASQLQVVGHREVTTPSNARQHVGGNSTTRPSWRPKSQTSMRGGSTPSVVRAVQIWLR